jgi:hypothetical protein
MKEMDNLNFVRLLLFFQTVLFKQITSWASALYLFTNNITGSCVLLFDYYFLSLHVLLGAPRIRIIIGLLYCVCVYIR